MFDLPELSDIEQKRLKIEQDRSNKISKLMGEYLLKGYKMLGMVCPKCQTILMQSRQQELYCLGCEEVDDLQSKALPNVDVNQRNNNSLTEEKPIKNRSCINVIQKQVMWATDRLNDDTLTIDQRSQYVHFIKICCETLELLKISIASNK